MKWDPIYKIEEKLRVRAIVTVPHLYAAELAEEDDITETEVYGDLVQAILTKSEFVETSVTMTGINQIMSVETIIPPMRYENNVIITFPEFHSHDEYWEEGLEFKSSIECLNYEMEWLNGDCTGYPSHGVAPIESDQVKCCP